jgi:hypothetical protein
MTQLVSAGVSLLTLNLTVLVVGALDTYAQSSPATTFSDVQPNYWAQPFIQGLAARNIVTIDTSRCSTCLWRSRKSYS